MSFVKKILIPQNTLLYFDTVKKSNIQVEDSHIVDYLNRETGIIGDFDKAKSISDFEKLNLNEILFNIKEPKVFTLVKYPRKEFDCKIMNLVGIVTKKQLTLHNIILPRESLPCPNHKNGTCKYGEKYCKDKLNNNCDGIIYDLTGFQKILIYNPSLCFNNQQFRFNFNKELNLNESVLRFSLENCNDIISSWKNLI